MSKRYEDSKSSKILVIDSMFVYLNDITILSPFADSLGAEATLASSQRKIFLVSNATINGVIKVKIK
jgi:hypothetical protein